MRNLQPRPIASLPTGRRTTRATCVVILPDTYGTSNFLKNAPDWVASWTGIRIDSKDPLEGGEEAIDWWLSRGQNPREKLAIFSDGLDVDLIQDIHRHFRGRMRIGYGWGTLLTNDFRGLAPDGALDPISIVCKVISANGRPALKLSDNPLKAMGPRAKSSATSASSTSACRRRSRSWCDEKRLNMLRAVRPPCGEGQSGVMAPSSDEHGAHDPHLQLLPCKAE